jgi:predicted ATP-grasp superfamily ATP-dependent carboligase
VTTSVRHGTVVVTDLEGRGALAACRSLARAGYRLVGVSSTKLAPGRWSRTLARRFLLPDPRRDARAFVDALAAAAVSERADVLIVGSDATLLAVSAGRDRLESQVRIGLPGHDVVLRVTDKAAVGEAAAVLGLAPPVTIRCTSTAEVARAAERLGYPLVLKPPRSVATAGAVQVERRSRHVRRPAELERTVSDLGVPLLCQEALTGAVHSVAGVVADAALRAAVVARYRRTWPADAGAAAFAETIAPDEELLRRVEGLVTTLGWNGIFEVEVIRRPDASYAVIDFNPRIYGSLALSQAAGAPLATIWCDTLLGRAPAGFSAGAAGIAYRCEDFDARHLFLDLSRRRAGDALDVLRPRRHVAHAYADLRDPAPLAVRWVGGIVRRVRRR